MFKRVTSETAGDRQPRPRLGDRLRDLGGKLVLAFVATLVALGGAEGIVRLVRPQQLVALPRGDVWMAADVLGWKHRPNADTRINTGERDVRFCTDHQGFRIGERGRIDSDVSLLLIGDSFTEAIQVEHEQSFAGLLEESLPRFVGRPVAIRNAGVAKWNPNHYLLAARLLIKADCHDCYAALVVCLYAGNDVVTWRQSRFSPRPEIARQRHHFRVPVALSSSELIAAVLYPLNDILKSRSHLFVLAKSSAETLLMHFGLTASYLPAVINVEAEKSEGWDITADIAADIAGLAEANGVRAYFVLIPAAYQVDQAVRRKYLTGFGVDPADVDFELPSRKLVAAFGDRGLVLIDLLADFRQASATGEQLYGKVDRHLSPRGHARLAAVLSPILGHGLGQELSAASQNTDAP